MKKQLEWSTEKRKVNDLVPYEYNPRYLSDKQKEQLLRSLEKFNLVEIPAINTDNKLIAGHQRCKLMQELGRGEEMIDVRVPNRKLTEKEFKEYNVRSNANTGSWDLDVLNENFLDIDIEDIGLDLGKIEFFNQQEEETEEETLNVPGTQNAEAFNFISFGTEKFVITDEEVGLLTDRLNEWKKITGTNIGFVKDLCSLKSSM